MDRQFRLLGKIFLATCLVFSVRIRAATSLPDSSKRLLPERAELASNDRRATRSKDTVSVKHRTRKISYNYLLPFGVGQFERDKDILGLGLAAGQVGFLLLYFDRIQQINTANNDARGVKLDFEKNGRRDDPTLLAYINNKEAYVRKSAQESRFAMLGFMSLYGLGVAEAIFNPFDSVRIQPTKKRKELRNRREATSFGKDTRLVQVEATSNESISNTQAMDSKIRLFYNLSATQLPGSVGISFQQSL